MTDKLIDGLRRLDPENNDHWTADGAPKVAVVAELIGDLEDQLTRQQIVDAAPALTRGSFVAWIESLDGGDQEEEDDLPPQDDPEAVDALAELHQQRDDLTEALGRAKATSDDAQAAYDELRAKLEKVEEAIQAKMPPVNPIDAIKKVTSCQRRARAERMVGKERSDRVFEASPLDQRLRHRPSARVRAQQLEAQLKKR